MYRLKRPIELLLVEDNEADIRLTEIAFERVRFENNLHVVRDGEAALSYLRQEGEYAGSPRPDMVLLDLQLPKLNGASVLRTIRSDSRLRDLPVVILTTSEADRDIYESYELHANCYVTKPVNLQKYVGVIEMIEDFWKRVSPAVPEN